MNAAMDAKDGTAVITNNGDSQDRLPRRMHASHIVRTVSIETLRKEQPILENVGFVKIDTEGYERVIVPALESFLREKKPAVYISLHPMYLSHEVVQGVVDKLTQIFPYLYEVDMQTPFNGKRSSYRGGDHGGTDVVCTWTPL